MFKSNLLFTLFEVAFISIITFGCVAACPNACTCSIIGENTHFDIPSAGGGHTNNEDDGMKTINTTSLNPEHIIVIDCNNRRLRSFPDLFCLSEMIEAQDVRPIASQPTFINDIITTAKNAFHVAANGLEDDSKSRVDLSVQDENVARTAIHNPTVHILANGNAFTYLLQSKLLLLETLRVKVLEISHNQHVMDITPNVIDNLFLKENLLRLRIGPVRQEYVSKLLQNVASFKQLTELVISGRDSAFDVVEGEDNGGFEEFGIELSPSTLPPNLHTLKLSTLGTLIVKDDHVDHNQEHDYRLTLKNITLSGLRLTSVPTFVARAIFSTLTDLDLSRNSLEKLWQGQGPMYTRIHSFYTNQINMCKLVNLDLSFNRLVSLEDGILKACPDLASVDLSHNIILSDLGYNPLRGLSNIKFDISFTRVTSLNNLSADQIDRLSVIGAKLPCGCGLLQQVLRLGGHQKVNATCENSSLETTHEFKQQQIDIQHIAHDCDHDSFRFRFFRKNEDKIVFRERNREGGFFKKILETSQSDIKKYLATFLPNCLHFKQMLMKEGEQVAQDENITHGENMCSFRHGVDQYVANGSNLEALEQSIFIYPYFWGHMQNRSPCGLCVYTACAVHSSFIFAAFFVAGQRNDKALGFVDKLIP